MAHELMTGYGRKDGPPGCSFKIDIQKAYDTVDWRFLSMVLEGMGFHPIMRHWIMEVVTTTSYSIIVNGKSHGFFKGARGIRQGCPLSPYLFTLVMEAFNCMFRRRIDEGVGFLYHKGCSRLLLTHLCFADDLMVFTYGDVPSVSILKEALDDFANYSGLRPSLAKSSIYLSNVHGDTKDAILSFLPFQVGSLPFRYLGVPLSSKRPSVAGILNWKSKFLSFGGRLQLIRSVLESLQLYWMMVFTIQSSVVQDLERLFRDFLWAHGNSSKGKARVAWDEVCRPKKMGGLGIKRLASWNRTLLVSHIWDILRRRKSLWVSWLYLHRLRSSNFWTVPVIYSSNWFWRRLLALCEQVRPSFFHVIGNGEITNAWEDNWLGVGHLSQFISYRIVHLGGFTTSSTVANILPALHQDWPATWVDRCAALSTHQVPSLYAGINNHVMWKNGANHIVPFTVFEAWKSVIGQFHEVPWHNFCWFPKHIPKHSFCLWLALRKRLPTQDRMLIWRVDGNDLRCTLCNSCLDSHDHLFFECSFSIQIWRLFKSDLATCPLPDRWASILDDIAHRRWRPGETRKRLTFAAIIYFIWHERNGRLFDSSKRTVDQIVMDVKRIVMMRLGSDMGRGRMVRPGVTQGANDD